MLGSTAASSSKSYGRSGTSKPVDSVFSRRPTADPFLFDSDDGERHADVKSKSQQPAKKKSKLKSSSSHSVKSARLTSPKNNTTAHRGEDNDAKSSQSSRTKSAAGDSGSANSAGVRKHNTRHHGSSSTKDSIKPTQRYPPMQITSTTVLRSETVDSDFENTAPSFMSISTETVCMGEVAGDWNGDGGRLRNRSQSPRKSTSTTRSYESKKTGSIRSPASSVDSRDSAPAHKLVRAESDRLKQFLQSGLAEPTTTDISNHSLEGVESDRLKQSLYLGRTRSTRSSRSSLNSQSSVDNHELEPEKNGLPKKTLRSHAARSTRSSRSSQSSMDNHPIQRVESERLKRFLHSEETKSTTSSIHSADSAGNERLRRVRAGRHANSRDSSIPSPETVVNTHPLESARLKQFLASSSNHLHDPGSLSDASSTERLEDQTLVASDFGTRESKRLQDFLNSSPDHKASEDRTFVSCSSRARKSKQSQGSQSATNNKTSDSDSKSNSSPSSLSSPKLSTYRQRESRRLREFLGDVSSSRDSSPEKGVNTSSNHTGLSQPIFDCSLDTSRQQAVTSKQKSPQKRTTHASSTSPPKRRYIDDKFSFTSDSEDNTSKDSKPSLRTPVSGAAGSSTGSALISGKTSNNASSSKPVINFEKMEGKKERPSASRPLKKLLGNAGKAAVKYRYNHRAWLDDQNDEESEASDSSKVGKVESLRRPLQLKKVEKYPDKLGERISSQLKVRQDHKQLYTVVRNVRQAHECQDHGENQQIDDDLEFLLDGLEPRIATSSRYLSAVSLAKKCTNPTFRMYLRSQGSLTQAFTSLSDAPSDPRLALSATAIMFMLCQDRLNMDLDRRSLQLMVDLLEYDDRAHLERKQEIEDYEKSITTVYDLYRSAIPAGEELLEKTDLSPGYLAMECLLVLTSRRSGDWFKEELREVGALVCIADSIIDKTVTVMTADYDMELSQLVLMLIKKICRGLRVLEHVTAYNNGNQRLMIEHRGGEFVLSLCRLLMFGVEAIATHSIDSRSSASSAGHLLLQLMLGILRVLVNITHNTEAGCEVVSSFGGIVEVLLKCVLQCPQYVLGEQRFDLLVLGIGLSINMCEHSAECREVLLNSETLSSYDSICEQETMTSVEALLALFDQRLAAAARIEQESEVGNLRESDIATAIGEEPNETLTEVLHKAGRHMEDTIVASYIALLIGVIVEHSPDYTDQIKGYIPSHNFNEIISVLTKFLDFMKMADAASGNTGSKSIATVINYLKECS